MPRPPSGCVAALPACAQELKFANFAAPTPTVATTIIDRMNAEISAATEGALSVKGFLGGELGSGPAEQYVRVLQGAADMAWGLPGYTSSQFPQTMIVELPGVLPHGKAGYDALWDAFDEHLSCRVSGSRSGGFVDLGTQHHHHAGQGRPEPRRSLKA